MPSTEDDRADPFPSADRADATSTDADSLPPESDSLPPDADPAADALADRVAELEATVERQEAAIEALRGYVGAIRAVNEEVERRADLALATARNADDLEADPDPAVAAAVPDPPSSDAREGSTSPADDGTGEDDGPGDVRAALSRLRDAL